jgi:DNA-directed RNA polymerase subunit RPC12/RpoP
VRFARSVKKGMGAASTCALRHANMEGTMTSQPKSCSQCRKAVSLSSLDAIQGEEAGVRVTLKGMPAYVCEVGHKRFVSPEFGMQYIKALFSSESALPAPAGEKRGLLRKRYHCAKCSEQLEPATAKSARVERSLEIKGSAPFAVEMDLPLYRCSSCGAEHLRPTEEITDAVMKASALAFRSVELNPT